MIGVIFALLVLGFIAWQVWSLVIRPKKARKAYLKKSFPAEWSKILGREVSFYARLNRAEKKRFELLVRTFLAHVKISGIKTDITATDQLLIGAAAIIPLFKFNIARYPNLKEVVLYPNHFDANYQLEGKGRTILGMVGNRHLNQTILLSKKALHHGFKNDRDGRNTAIHEFIHLIDAWDGSIDGIPETLMTNEAVGPWLEIIREKTGGIQQRKIKDINPYAAEKPAEFFAVASEYYFENPEKLQKHHPKLFDKLTSFFGGRS